MTRATDGSEDPRVRRSRAAVLETATELLMSGGLRAVSVDAVVARSGVAKSTVYRHWPSRGDLLRDAVDSMLPAPRPADLDAPLGLALRAAVNALADEFAAAPWAVALPALLEAAENDPDLVGLRQRLSDYHLQSIVQLLESAVTRGELPADLEVAEATSQLLGPLAFRVLLSHEATDRRFCDRMVDLFLTSRGISTTT